MWAEDISRVVMAVIMQKTIVDRPIIASNYMNNINRFPDFYLLPHIYYNNG